LCVPGITSALPTEVAMILTLSTLSKEEYRTEEHQV